MTNSPWLVIAGTHHLRSAHSLYIPMNHNENKTTTRSLVIEPSYPKMKPDQKSKRKKKTHIPIFLLRFRASVRASLSILGGYVATLLERRIPVFEDMLNAKLLPFESGLRAWTVCEGTRQGLLRPGHWVDAPPIRWQDVDPNSVHTNTCGGEKGDTTH